MSPVATGSVPLAIHDRDRPGLLFDCRTLLRTSSAAASVSRPGLSPSNRRSKTASVRSRSDLGLHASLSWSKPEDRVLRRFSHELGQRRVG